MEGASSWRTPETARHGNAVSRLANPSNTMNKPQNGLSRDPDQIMSPIPIAPNYTSSNSLQDHPRKPALSVVSINIEGFSESKAQILSHLCYTSPCDILCVQETHRDAHQLRPFINGMTLVAEIPHAKYGSAIFVKPSISVLSVNANSLDSIEIITVDIGKCTITSLYKPPKQPFKFNQTTNFNNHSFKIIVGDFNSHSTSWGYSKTNPDGDAVEQWAEANHLELLHNCKLPASFNSCSWKRGYNPDLLFVSNNLKSSCAKSVYSAIPNTQHKPIACLFQGVVKPNIVPFRRRFNFRKADWQKFSETVDEMLMNIAPVPKNYDLFVKIIWKASRQCIPRGCRTHHIPGLDQDSAKLLRHYEKLHDRDPFAQETIEAGEKLTALITETRRKQWVETVSEIDMTQNSKIAWSTLRKLTGDPPHPSNPGEVTANQVAHQLLLNGRTTHKLANMKNSSIANNNALTRICQPFALADVIHSVKMLKNGKAAGVDDITVEQLKKLGSAAISWLCALFNACLNIAHIPRLWRQAKVIALIKPGKPPSDPKSYRPISLLCHTFKLFERMLLNRLTPIIEPMLIPQQAGFRPGRSCTGQVLNLTEHIEEGFEANKITGVVFVDLSAAYDTVNIKRLLSKVLSMTNDHSFVKILGQLLQNRRFQVHLNGVKSRWRCQKNGLPQGSVLAPTLFNIYTNDQPCSPNTQSFLYADDLALASQAPDFESAEEILSCALDDLGKYYESNSLRPNPSKTQSCAFHLRNHQARRPLVIRWRDVDIEHCDNPKYLGVTLDRSLNFKQHCLNTKAKVCARNNLLRRLTSTSWGATPEVLRTTGLSLCFSAGEYACPVWHRSAHAREVDVALNETCRTISGCLKPTPIKMLYPLVGIAPPAVRREVACSTEKLKQQSDARHSLFNKATQARGRLKSRKSFLRLTVAAAPMKDASDARVELWKKRHAPPSDFIIPAEKLPPGYHLPWPLWKSLNRLRTQMGRCRCNLSRWGIIGEDDTECVCGEPLQTMSHLLNCPSCPSTCTTSDLMHCSTDALNVANYWSGVV